MRALLRSLRDERFKGNGAELGRQLGLTGQALSQSLRAERPTVPRFATARAAAKLAGYQGVWELLWPDLKGTAAGPRTHFDVAAEVARREGWPDAIIEDAAKQAAFNPERTPMKWLDIMRGAMAERSTSPPAVTAPPTPRERVHEDHVPETRPDTFAGRLKYLRIVRKMTTKQLARASGVTEGDIKALERGSTLGTPETWDNLRRAFGVSAQWLGTPIETATEQAAPKAAIGGRRA